MGIVGDVEDYGDPAFLDDEDPSIELIPGEEGRYITKGMYGVIETADVSLNQS
jgi:hypothetical protein